MILSRRAARMDLTAEGISLAPTIPQNLAMRPLLPISPEEIEKYIDSMLDQLR